MPALPAKIAPRDVNTTRKNRGGEILPPTPTDLDWAAKLEAQIRSLPTTFEGDNR